MKLQDIKDVLTFNAFLPEPDDSSATWRKRFASKRSLFLNIGKSCINWMSLGKGCKLQTPGKVDADQKSELKEIFQNHSAEWRKLTDGSWCGISINTRYIISLENNLSRRKGSEELLKTNPRQALGAKYEKGKRYAVTHNPESNTSLLLTCDEEQIKKIELAAIEASMKVARICVGTYAMIRHLLAEVAKTRPKGELVNPESGVIYIVCNHGAVCILNQLGDQWVELRSRTDVFNEDPQPIVDLLAPFLPRMTNLYTVALLNHDVDIRLSETITNVFPSFTVTDFTKPGQLWAILSNL